MLNYLDIGLDHLLKAVDSLASRIRLTPFESLYLDSKDEAVTPYSNLGLDSRLRSIGNLGDVNINIGGFISTYNFDTYLDAGAIPPTLFSQPKRNRYSWGVPESSGTSSPAGMIYPVVHDSIPKICWYKINQGTASIRIQHDGNDVVGSTEITATTWGTTTSFSLASLSLGGTLTFDYLSASGSPDVFAVLDCEEI